MAVTAAIANLAPTTLVGADPDGSVPAATEADPSAAPADLATTGLPTPQAAARNLWDAWRDADVPRALLYAAAPASETLMATPWGPEVRQAGCTAVEAGWLCRFEGPTIRWDLDINGSDTLGYRVRTVSTGAPNGIVLSPSPAGQLPGDAVVDTVVDTVVDGVLDHHGSVVAAESSTTSVVDAAARRTRTSKRRVTATTTGTDAPLDTTPAVRAVPADTTPAPQATAAEPPAPAPAPVPVARPAQPG